MSRGSPRRPRAGALALALFLAGSSTAVYADNAQDEIRALKEQMSVLMKRLEEISRKQEESAAKTEKIEQKVDSGLAAPAAASEPKLDALLKGFYGTLDVSVDDTTKGMSDFIAYHGDGSIKTNVFGGIHPIGNTGWMPALSTNKSVLGYRGEHKIADSTYQFIYQIEASLALTAAAGPSLSNSAQSSSVKGALGSGDSFVGVASKDLGKLKFGTSYTPYKKSTDRLNPFSGMLGDYAAVMGNSGGDNRVEFGTRQEHSVWFESPSYGNGLSFDFLWSPGQNRTYDNVIQSAGSSDCNGGNIPGSGNLPAGCDDGGFSNALSVALKYEMDNLYGVVAYESHQNVNRNSDGIGSNAPGYAALAPTSNLLDQNPIYALGTAFANAGGTPPFAGDIATEWAFKVGLQYKFDFGLTVSGIAERLRRDLPPALQFQNERSHDATWLALTQEFTPYDSVSLGWAHALATPGDPGGQHNYNPNNSDNSVEMFSLAYRRKLDKQLTWYLDAALTINRGNAHYDLGAGGRGVTTDCHDGSNGPATGSVVTDGSSNGPTTWGGCRVEGISTGLNYRF